MPRKKPFRKWLSELLIEHLKHLIFVFIHTVIGILMIGLIWYGHEIINGIVAGSPKPQTQTSMNDERKHSNSKNQCNDR
jgi:hypothetical protein